ncbi:MAG TPA: patatin-like phospholipase family protein [Candidatus Polarisedimenticolia bacterium]|nr:patatin-like phospholipase family protein [Candidatus Polarisedimenticolia bacterium]
MQEATVTRRAQPPRVALVLGSGGIKSIASLGLFRVLAREKIPIDLIAASSGGSLFATAYALYPNELERIEGFLWNYWKPEIFRDFDYLGLLVSLLRPRGRPIENFGLIKGKRILRNIHAMFPDKTFADTRIPLRIVATDIRSGRPVILKEGSVARAVRASVSLPLYMRPVTWGDYLLVDGGMTNPIPCDVAINEGAEVILAMSFGSSLDTPLEGPLSLLNQVVRVSASNLIRVQDDLHRTVHRGEIVGIYPAFDHVHSFFNFHTMEEIISRGEEASVAALPRIHAALKGLHSLTP